MADVLYRAWFTIYIHRPAPQIKRQLVPDSVKRVSLVAEVARLKPYFDVRNPIYSVMAQKQVYERTPGIALAFYRQKYKKEKPRGGVKSTVRATMPGLSRGEEDNEGVGGILAEGAEAAAGAEAADPVANDPASQVRYYVSCVCQHEVTTTWSERNQ